MNANRIGLLVAILITPFVVSGQAPDTTAKYPWRMSYFPYPAVTPNDGLMGLGRVVFFRQSRWDDRVSLTDEVAVEGGYSTKDAWLARVRGDFPALAARWRLEFQAGAERTRQYAAVFSDSAALRQFAAAELSFRMTPWAFVALRGRYAHTDYRGLSERDAEARIALVIDRRDREYDTRSGYMIQGGAIFGRAHDSFRASGGLTFDSPSMGYGGSYGIAAGWLRVDPTTSVSARAGWRALGDNLSFEAARSIPGWERDILVLGGAESNRGLLAGERPDRRIYLASVEIRHELKRFPAAGVSVLAFVDAGRAFDPSSDDVTLAGAAEAQASSSEKWVVAPGGGVAIRLLRNAILTSTVGVAKGKARFYVSSGWAW